MEKEDYTKLSTFSSSNVGRKNIKSGWEVWQIKLFNYN